MDAANCQHCNNEIDYNLLIDENIDLFRAVDNAELEEFTGFQEQVYHQMHCAQCAKRLLAEEEAGLFKECNKELWPNEVNSNGNGNVTKFNKQLYCYE